MSELRESDYLHEIEDGSDNRILYIFLRLLQLAFAIGGARHAILSVLEKGFTAEAIPSTLIAIGAPIILETVMRGLENEHVEMYDRET